MLQPKGRADVAPRKASKLRRCQCSSQCAKWNPLTERYEGAQWVTESTRQRHLVQDRYSRVEKKYRQSKSEETPTFKVISLKDKVDMIGREVMWLSSLPLTSSTARLAFQHDPRHLPYPKDNMLALDEKNHANSSVIFVEARYNTLLLDIQKLPQDDDRDEVIGRIMDCLQALDRLKGLEWDQQSKGRDPHGRVIWTTEKHFRRKGPSHRTVRAAHVLSLVLQNVHFVPRRALRIHLRGLQGVLRAANCDPSIVDAFPLDPRTCSKAFDIDPVVRQYLSCPKCHCLYPFDVDNDPVRLPNCTHRQTPSSPQCGAELWGSRRLTGDTYRPVPLRKYYHHELKSWIGELLARPGMEDLLEEPTFRTFDPDAPVGDIWGAQAVRDLKCADGKPFFDNDRPNREQLRLLFGLAVDGFLPYNADTQTISSTGIWLVLYNLPIHLRYLPQYVFLAGVIPGPNKPSKDEINHYIQLVVNDLRELWQPGVFISRTHKYFSGRTSLGMLVLVLGDHPGLRQLIGYAGLANAHYLCTECDVDIDDIHVVNRSQWPMKNAAEIRRYATSWKDAPNKSTQRAIFEAYGWRWSPLFDLPYWDPVVCSVVDTMHALDLNLFKTHCRILFGIDADHAGGDRSSALTNPFVYGGRQLEDNDSNVEKCKRVLQANGSALLDQLLEFDRAVLHKVCVGYNVVDRVIGVRHILATHLYDWRTSLTADNLSVFDDLEEPTDTPPNIADGSRAEMTKKYRIIRKLLSECSRDWDSARTQSNFELHGELCKAVAISILPSDTKATRHTALLQKIQADENARQKLRSLLPPSQLARLDSHATRQADDSDLTSVSGSQATDIGNAPTNQGLNSQPPAAPQTVEGGVLSKIKKASDPTAMRRLFCHILKILPDGVDEAALLAALSVTVKIHEEACSILNIPLPASQEGQRRKEQLNRTLLNAIENNDDLHNELTSLLPAAERDNILDKHVMGRIWKDMQETQLPSWIKHAPPNWGTAKRGTLSANHWQVICTIHLPVTLIWLWRDESDDSRKRALLTNFMHLVTASRLAYLRVSTPEQIAAFEYHISVYIDGIKSLFPAHPLKPTHHTAMHIGDMMRSFGPDHCRNARYYERYILFLHRIGTNNKLGEMEKSFLEFSSRYANLCAILEDDVDLCRDMDAMIQGIESIKKEDLRGFNLSFASDPLHVDFSADKLTAITLNDETEAELIRLQHSINLTPCSREIYSLPQISQGGVRYAPYQSRRYRDSSVVFCTRSEATGPAIERCGFIQLIFRQLCTRPEKPAKDEFFLVVDEHTPISTRGTRDPYKAFGFAAGYLCDKVASQRHVIALSDVVCQFAATPIEGTEYVHIMPVNRLMHGLDMGPDNRAF